MKIFFVTVFPNQNSIHAKDTGVGSYTYMLAEEMQKKQEINTIEIWAQKGKDLLDYTLQKITVKRVWDKNILGVFSLVKKIIFERPGVIHIQHEFNLFGGILAAVFSPLIVITARLCRSKVITTMHGGFSLGHIDKQFVVENGSSIPPVFIKLGFRIIFGIFAYCSHEIIVHESWQKDDLIQEYFVNRDKINVIPHGVVEYPHIADNAREVLSIPPAKKVFLFMGFASAYKGLEEMYDHYKEFITKPENKDTLLIIGAGKSPRMEGLPQYESWYKNLQDLYTTLGDSVRWVGFIPGEEISLYYNAADVVVFPYSRRLAASGPMAIAISYEKDLVLSSILQGNTQYAIDFYHTQKTDILKINRIWSKVSNQTLALYKKYYENFTSNK